MGLVSGCEHRTRSWCKKESGLRIVDGRLSSLKRSQSTLSYMKKQRLISEVSKLCFEMTKKTSTFIIHIQKRHNHWSALLSAIKLHSAMVSFLLPMTSYTNLYLAMTIDLQLEKMHTLCYMNVWLFLLSFGSIWSLWLFLIFLALGTRKWK